MDYKVIQGIVFGSSKAGKSNLINELTKTDTLSVSSKPDGETKDSISVQCDKNSNSFIFWDTAGLFENDGGTVPHKDAFMKLFHLIKKIEKKDKVSFIIFVFKDTLKENDKKYLELIKSVFNEEVNILVVMTHQYEYLSQEDPSDERYQITKDTLNSLGVKYQFIPVSFEKVDEINNTEFKNKNIITNKTKSYDSCWKALSIYDKPQTSIYDKPQTSITDNLKSTGIIHIRYESLTIKLIKYFIESIKIKKSLEKEKGFLKNLGYNDQEIKNIYDSIKKE